MSDILAQSRACNRRPFSSGDGCDRGNVDITQFDDLPYCDPIDPTGASVPPEILDSPLVLPVPPPCSCVNVGFKFNMGYGSSFKSNGKFSAVGDCCEGNYVAEFDLQMGCSIKQKGQKFVGVSIGYGNGSPTQRKPYIDLDSKDCSFIADNADLELNIPCPIKTSGDNNITVGIGYGSGDKRKSIRYIQTDNDNCSITPLSPEIDLQIPCPVIGRGKANITIESGFKNVSSKPFYDEIDAEIEIVAMSGNEDSEDEDDEDEDDEDEDSEDLTDYEKYLVIGALRELQRDWIIREGPEGMRTTQRKTIKENYVESDPSNCNITPLSPNFDLSVPCPVVFDGVKRMKFNPIEFVPSEEVPSEGVPTEIPYLYESPRLCRAIPLEPEINLQIPCPVTTDDKNITVGIDYGPGDKRKKVKYVKADEDNCTITPLETEINLNIPCPIDTSEKTKIRIVGYGNAETIEKKLLHNRGNCEASVEGEFNLRVPCPGISVAPDIGETRLNVRHEGNCVDNNQVFYLSLSGQEDSCRDDGPFWLCCSNGHYEVGDCNLFFGREQLFCPNTTFMDTQCDASTVSRSYFLIAHISHFQNMSSLEVIKSAVVRANSLSDTYLPLYKITEGVRDDHNQIVENLVEDKRGQIFPAMV